MMRHLIPRAALTVMLLLAVLLPAAWAEWRPETPAPDALRALLESQGLRDITGSTWAPGQFFDVSIAGCSGRIHVYLVSSLMEDQTFVESRLPSGSVRAFFFLDKSWTTLDRAEIWTMYAGAQARNAVRGRPLNYLDNIIEVASPSRCDALKSIAWCKYWSDD